MRGRPKADLQNGGAIFGQISERRMVCKERRRRRNGGGICGFDPHQRTRISDPAPPTLFPPPPAATKTFFLFLTLGLPLANPPLSFSLSSPLTSSGGAKEGRAKRPSNCIYVGRGGWPLQGGIPSLRLPLLLCLAKKTPPGKEFTECQRLLLAFVPRNPILKHPVWFPLLSPKKCLRVGKTKPLGGHSKKRMGWRRGRLCDATQIPAHAPQQRTTQKELANRTQIQHGLIVQFVNP